MNTEKNSNSFIQDSVEYNNILLENTQQAYLFEDEIQRMWGEIKKTCVFLQTLGLLIILI